MWGFKIYSKFGSRRLKITIPFQALLFKWNLNRNVHNSGRSRGVGLPPFSKKRKDLSYWCAIYGTTAVVGLSTQFGDQWKDSVAAQGTFFACSPLPHPPPPPPPPIEKSSIHHCTQYWVYKTGHCRPLHI